MKKSEKALTNQRTTEDIKDGHDNCYFIIKDEKVIDALPMEHFSLNAASFIAMMQDIDKIVIQEKGELKVVWKPEKVKTQ